MKTIVTTLAIAALTLFGAAPQAEAGHSTRVYISGYRSCGTPIYSERYFIGYDHCGRPIWGTRVIRPRYVAPCPPRYYPPVRCDRGYRGDGFTIQATFRR